MNMRKYLVPLFMGIILLITLPYPAFSNWYDVPIEYQEAITKILNRGDISWGSKADDYYKYGSIVASADGSTVLLTGKCEFCDDAEVRPFLVNPDGSGLEDISDMLPSELTNKWSGWRNLSINDDGSKVFFRAVLPTSYYGDEYLYVYDVATGRTALNVNQRFSPFPSNWHFRINENGSSVYLDKYDAGYDTTLLRHKAGLFYADTGGAIQWYFDVGTLNCRSECGNLNLFSLLGVSVRDDLSFFSWNSDYAATDGSNQHTGLWYTGLNGNATLLSQEHYWIDPKGDWRGMCDVSGTKLIYQYKHENGDARKLGLVSVPDGTESILGWTSGWNGCSAHISRSGQYVLANC